MFLKILYFIFVVLIFRLALRMIRLLFSSPRERPRVHPRARGGESLTSGKRVIDVEYTEPERTKNEEEAR
jgi:hypothetical protein